MFRVPAPNFTQAPNALFDEWLPLLKLVELRVLMVILRKTFGWHKIRDRISLSQLEKCTGSQRRDIIKATDKLQKLGLITKEVVGEMGDQDTFYELVVQEDSKKSYQCESHTPPSVNLTPTKETKLTKERVVCVAEPPAKPSAGKIRKLNGLGEPFEVDQSDLFSRCIQARKDWSTQEILDAWKIIDEYSGPINDWFRFVEGTIENTRKKRSLDKLKSIKNENNKKVKKQCIIQTDPTAKITPVDRDTLMRLFPGCK